MRKITLITAAIIIATNLAFSQGTAINTNGAKADSSALLDVSSTGKGVLIPRMTQAQRLAISNAAEGLTVFDLDNNTLYFWRNGFWWKVLSSKECPGFSVTAGSNSPVISGNTINLTSTPSGGTPPYTYSWTGPSGFTSTTQNPIRTDAVGSYSGTYTVQVTEATGCIITGTTNVQVITVQAYNYTGGNQTFDVPSGVSSIQVKIWGAGGGGSGGGAAFVNGNLAVTQGQALTVMVGGTCNNNGCSNTYGGGGSSSVAKAGGGRSAIQLSGVELVTAGGGGGQGSSGSGGAAGGISGITSTGSDGTNSCTNGGGKGGVLTDLNTGAGYGGAAGSACGSNPPSPGGQFYGGNSPNSGSGYSGGGGGSGYYGGGGGGPMPGSGGGGGCSYYNPGSFTLISSASGSGGTAGGTSDPDWANNAGNGGNHGRIVIIY